MMKTYIYALVLTVFASCQYEVDNSNPLKLAEALQEGLSQNNNTILRKIFIHEMDSLDKNSRENLNKAHVFFNENKKIRIFKIDTPKLPDLFGEKMIYVYYKKDDNFYGIRMNYSQDISKRIKPNNFMFFNVNEECKKEKNIPYRPFLEIDFKSLEWATDYSGKQYKYGKVVIKNNTDIDLNYIKFRVILKQRLSSSVAETFLSQTVESYKHIYKGDIVKIEVSEMSDYFTGFKVEKENVLFNAQLIEVRPKPESYFCKTLKKLEAMNINDSNDFF